MTTPLLYTPAAARRLIADDAWSALAEPLEQARRETLNDVDLLNSGDAVPEDKQPLDAGFIEYPRRLLSNDVRFDDQPLLDVLDDSAQSLRERIDRLVVLGIGGSYMGLRALHEALSPFYYNELPRDARGDAPRLYFEGDNLDNDSARALRDFLTATCSEPAQRDQRWGIVVISKSGGTFETDAAFRLFRDAHETCFDSLPDDGRKLIVPITGQEGKLRAVAESKKYAPIFPVPDGIGGRYSVFTPVGLFPAAVLGIDIRQLLQGAVDMTERFKSAPIGENPVLDYVATCHILERDAGATIRVLSTWGKRLEAVGLWYDQLLAESLGKTKVGDNGETRFFGATPITGVNTRDLHSRGQQHQEGRRDKLITNVIVSRPGTDPVTVPEEANPADPEDRDWIGGRTLPELLSVAVQGTNDAYAAADRPTADIVLDQLDAHTLGQLLQMFMLATVVEGRLIGVNPYGQPGVEAYKRNMKTILGE